MNQQQILEKLEFQKTLNSITRYCKTGKGKEYVNGLLPFADIEKAIYEGGLVSQSKEVLIALSEPPLENLDDISDDLAVSRIEGALLQPPKIMQVLKLAICSRETAQFLKHSVRQAPDLEEYAGRLFIDKVFEMHIARILDENGEVKDSASRELARIRADLREKNFQLRKLITRIAKDLSEEDVLREDYLTLRDGRMVVPIRVEHKRHIKGFIHSESASGQTVYIEPEETLHLNNEIVTLTFAERREIDRILRELTSKIGESSYVLQETLQILGFIDSLFARAAHSIEIIGSFPTFFNDKPFNLLDARHPLLLHKLGRAKTVPLNLKIDKNRVIIVTGPNAGGKTVVLKSIGLLTLMVFSGIHIPASPDTNYHLIDNLFVDIGDAQSIEEDLSTFSSHLSNIKNILATANENSLVLLDELGTGTDPTAGAALGTATLMKLKDIGALTFCTTHHGVLKTLAETYEGFDNAAMEFDTAHLQPTYVFRQGLPGSSYAFEIAGRLGFDKDFLLLAESFLEKDEHRLEQSLLQIEKKEHELRDKLNFYETENARLKGMTNMYQKKMEKIEADKKEILRKTKEEAHAFMHNANREIERVIKEIRESSAAKDSVKDAKIFLQSMKENTEKIIPEKKQEAPPELKIEIGRAVKIRETGTIGTIIEIYKEKESVKLLAGAIPMIVETNKLEPAIKDKTAKAGGHVHFTSRNNAGYRIDIRGKRPEEIEIQVIKFIDEAYSSGMDRIEILHGKGTGILKKMVKDILKEHIGVKTHYFAPVEFGGEGITVVELKS